MIGQRRLAPLLTAIALFVNVATAGADCAWVLWMKADYDAALDGEWGVVQAVATREECIGALQEMLAPSLDKFRASAAGDEAITRAADALERSAARGSVVVIGRGQSRSMKCLPDTVDPRVAKARSTR